MHEPNEDGRQSLGIGDRREQERAPRECDSSTIVIAPDHDVKNTDFGEQVRAAWQMATDLLGADGTAELLDDLAESGQPARIYMRDPRLLRSLVAARAAAVALRREAA